MRGCFNGCHMTRRPIDQHAIRIPQSSGLLPCLYVPVAARDTNSIEKYVGTIVRRLSRHSPSRAYLIEAHKPEKPDQRLAIWRHPGALILQSPRQVWVHVDYNDYRRAYLRAFHVIWIACPISSILKHRSSSRANSTAGSADGWQIDSPKDLNHRSSYEHSRTQF